MNRKEAKIIQKLAEVFILKHLLKSFFFLPCLLCTENLEVQLTTQSQLKPLYLSRLNFDSSEHDWRYFDELRGVIEEDLSLNGFCSVLSIRDDFEDHLKWPDVRKEFDLGFWKKQKIPYLLSIQAGQKKVCLIAFDLEKEASKKYETILTGHLDEDRKAIHRLSDTITKDLFGIEGIASLKIIYSQRTKQLEQDWQSEIWVCDSDGLQAKQITFDGGYSLSPGFFPKTSSEEDLEFYYVSYKQGQSKIYRSSLSQRTASAMIGLRGNQALPSISKEGKLFAFIGDVAGRPDLFLQALDKQGRLLGKARQIYSQPRATQASPTFSPDGRYIAFVSDKDGPPRIYRIEVPSPKSTKRLKPELLTSKNRENTSPAWSPDGKKLAYSAKVEGIRQIWVYDFATKEEKQLTQGEENKENPSWAPDSLHLVYNTESDDRCELFLLHLNEPNPVCISKGLGQKRFPNFEPR